MPNVTIELPSLRSLQLIDQMTGLLKAIHTRLYVPLRSLRLSLRCWYQFPWFIIFRGLPTVTQFALAVQNSDKLLMCPLPALVKDPLTRYSCFCAGQAAWNLADHLIRRLWLSTWTFISALGYDSDLIITIGHASQVNQVRFCTTARTVSRMRGINHYYHVPSFSDPSSSDRLSPSSLSVPKLGHDSLLLLFTNKG